MTAPSTITFAEFLRTPELAGEEWQKPTRAPWHALAKIITCEPLNRAETRLLKACTGLSRPPRDVRQLVLLIGRRGGKSHFLAAFAVWVAVFAADWRSILTRGERGVVLLLSRTRREAQVLARYATGLCQLDLIAPEVVRLTAEEIEFASGAVLEVGVSDFRTVRGRTCLAVIGDEACFWATEGASSDEEVIAAAEPAMATIPGGGWLMLSSSPWKPSGLMHQRWRDLLGQQKACDRRRAVCWVAPSRTMNPALSKAYVDQKLAEDPIRNACEYVINPASPWRSTDADFLPDDAIKECTDWEIGSRPPEAAMTYVAFTDAAGGTGTDSFTLAVAHLDGSGRPVLDHVEERKPRFVPSTVAAEFAAVLKRYGVTEVFGDRVSWTWSREVFAEAGITYWPSKLTKSELYLAGLPLLLSHQARLLDSDRLRRQLSSLERTVHAGGRESVDAARGAPEDLANAAIGALVMAYRRGVRGAVAIFSTYGLCGRHTTPSALSGTYAYG